MPISTAISSDLLCRPVKKEAVKVKSLRARRRTRPGHHPSTAGGCLLPVFLFPMCSNLVCLSPSPQCDARLFWVFRCFSSPRASIQGQQHSRCSLATCVVAPTLYILRTFQCPITTVFLGVTMELIRRWASRRVSPIVVILSLLAPMPPPESLIVELSVVSLTCWVFTGAGSQPAAQPPTRRTGAALVASYDKLQQSWRAILNPGTHTGHKKKRCLFIKYKKECEFV